MDYALMTEPQVGGSYDDLLGVAKWAESAGLVAFARSDHYLNMAESAHATDAMATLAGLARDTTSIRLTVLVSPITFRHPAIIAKTATTIDEMSGGRLELGIGTGWMQQEHDAFGLDLPPLRERFSRLYETLAYIHAAFGRSDETGFHGRHYHLDDIEVMPRPTGPLPIIVGGTGRSRTPMMAGRFAQEYNVFASSPETLAIRLGAMRDAAGSVGRDPDEILVSTMTAVYVGVDAADYEEVLGEAAASRGQTPEELAELLRKRGTPHGTADEVADHIAAWSKAGVGRIYIHDYSHLASIDTDRLDSVLAMLP